MSVTVTQGAILDLTVDYPFIQTLTLPGYDATGWTEIAFVAKANETDADSAAIIAVKLSNPGSGGDGLILLNGAVPSGSTTASDGSISAVSIVVASRSSPAASTTLTLSLSARGTAIPAGGYFWELAVWQSGTKGSFSGNGILNAKPSVIASPTAL